ncbi:hypothetical protein AB0A69_18200 [Streptomyces sp. NPDC045431]|uniref:hypothetical protein n=1 Tax=Streptomyces sp. NPDC045431 TaxID=3155613 RepID=UPI0033D45487
MSTEARRPSSRITDALLPPERPASPERPTPPEAPAPAVPQSAPSGAARTAAPLPPLAENTPPAEPPTSPSPQSTPPASPPRQAAPLPPLAPASPPTPPPTSPPVVPPRPAAPRQPAPAAAQPPRAPGVPRPQAPVAPQPPAAPQQPAPAAVETTARLRPVRQEPGAESTARLRPVPHQSAPAGAPAGAPAVASAPSRRPPVGSVHLGPAPSGPPVSAPHAYWGPLPPEAPVEQTTRLRPVRDRHPARTGAALACLVLGLGLIGGAVAGAWLAGGPSPDPAARTAYTEARTLWHSVPVDTLFPRTLKGEDAGPGRADRVWTRVAVAPDGPCAGALDPLLLKALRPVGCARVLRATYTDATSTSVTTVGMVFTQADATAMTALRARFGDESLDERPDLMPRTLPAPGTVAAGFGDKQRASWRVSVLTEAPVIVYAVSGFADGRTVPDPQPAAEAMAEGQTTASAQAGLGHEAKGIADRVERGLRAALAKATSTQEPQ